LADADTNSTITELTADIVASYVANNAVSAADLPALIKSIYGTVSGLKNGTTAETPAERPKPAVSLRQAVQPDYVVDLFTGLKFKSLKRHLRTKHDMTPEEYRAYWGLPVDSPMVAPNYSAARSKLAKTIGLGQGSQRKAAKAPSKARKAK
jgi:predicted transcriptional regulator